MFILYLIFVFLVLRFTVTLFNFISNPKLTPAGRRYKDLVSILIPVYNNPQIVDLLKSIHDQDYKDYEVLICDTGSTDQTFRLCDQFCKRHQQFTVYRSDALPVGWKSKNFACYQLARKSKGKYFMFIDANDYINNGLIHNSIYRMKIQKLSLLSLFANQKTYGFGEQLVVPLMHLLLLNLLPLRLVRLSKNASFVAASSQFMFFDAITYQEHEWHAEVKNKVAEDFEIMRLVKGFGYHGETLLANGFLSCRKYRSFTAAVHGFSEQILAYFGNSILGLLLYLLLAIIGPLVILSSLDLELLLFAVTLIVLSRIMISLSSGQNPWLNVMLHPFQMLMLLFLAVLSIQKHLINRTVWRRRKGVT